MTDKEWIKFIKSHQELNNGHYKISAEDLINFLSQEKPKRQREEPLCDGEFINRLREIYSYIDVDNQFTKMNAWLLNNPERKLTRKFAVNWLNRQEKPVETYSKIKELMRR